MSNIQLIQGNCLEKLKELDDNSVDSIVTDPPYGLSFMGKKWDYDVPTTELWEEALRVLKPGGHLLAFFGTRTYHRGVVRIEDAGFEVRDMVSWVYGSGFPKSHNIAKSIDKMEGVKHPKNEVVSQNSSMSVANYTRNKMDVQSDLAKQHEGWGTALKPAVEPIVVARKPLSEKTVAKNVLKWGTGGINIDECRVKGKYDNSGRKTRTENWEDNTQVPNKKNGMKTRADSNPQGRFPANLIHDGSDEVVGLFPNTKSTVRISEDKDNPSNTYSLGRTGTTPRGHNDSGSAARFFYCAKSSKSERNAGLEGFEEKQTTGGGGLTAEIKEDGSYETASAGGKYGSIKAKQKNNHPTVKPIKLMQYLVRLVTPRGGTVLDPFMGSGSTGIASKKEGFNFIGIELDQEYYEIAKSRIDKSL